MREYVKIAELDDILFENEKAQAMIDCVQTLISEEIVEVRGVAKNTLDYTLYKASEMLQSNNERLLRVLKKNTETMQDGAGED